MIGIQIVGLDRLQRKLGRDLTPELSAFTTAIALEVQDKIAPYPPESAANKPVAAWTSKGRNQWYERGFGSRWIRKDGTFNFNKSSEMMNRMWAIRTPLSAKTSTVLGNRASYANWVHSAKDQTPFHKARQWKTDRAAIQEVVRSGAIGKLWAQTMRRVWR